MHDSVTIQMDGSLTPPKPPSAVPPVLWENSTYVVPSEGATCGWFLPELRLWVERRRGHDEL